MTKSQSNLNSIHSDILFCPIPVQDNEKQNLEDEVLSRAAGAFRLKAYHHAELLYSRAIRLYVKPTSYANRCLSKIRQGKYQEAVLDADQAIDLDPDWPKGYFRKAQAYEMLKFYRKSLEYYQITQDKANQSPENNNGLIGIEEKIKELETLVVGQFEKEPEVKWESESEILTPSPANNLPPDTTCGNNYIYLDNGSDSESEYQADKADNLKDDNPVELTEKVNLKMRGYRVRQDGSKTTFFNHEMSEEERQLIGDVRPKKIY